MEVVTCGIVYTGLIHANHGLKIMDYLANELRSSTSEVSLTSSNPHTHSLSH